MYLNSVPTDSDLAGAETMQRLMRNHVWAKGSDGGEMALVSIEVTPHMDQWMWAACLNSANGSGQGYRALPKWGKFANSRIEAYQAAADEVRDFLHRATIREQSHIRKWLKDVLAAERRIVFQMLDADAATT